jgi:ADP-ribosylglycohydrolase
MESLKSKVKGMLYGVAVGDALGQPHEMKPPLGHPVTDYPDTGGRTTDDWQLTRAMARGLIVGRGFDMPTLIKEHVAAYKTTTRGWGGAHRNACEGLSKGVSPKETGKLALDPAKPYRGRGNGMCMKISPLAAYHFVKKQSLEQRMPTVAELTMMTHATGMGLASAAAMEAALFYCLGVSPQDFDRNDFLAMASASAGYAESWVVNEENPPAEKLSERLSQLAKIDWNNFGPEEIIAEYKGGGYVYESLPFSLAFFCLGKQDLNCVYDCVGSGGDTDTNGSMVAALVGALQGEGIFPEKLLYKLNDFVDIDQVTEAFADWCKIQTPPVN